MFVSVLRTTALVAMFLFSLWLGPVSALHAQEQKEKAAAESTEEVTAETQADAADRYIIPDGDVETLAKFIDEIRKFRPTTTDEMLAHRSKAMGALLGAAEKIVELEKGRITEASQMAQTLVFLIKMENAFQMPRGERRGLFEATKSYLQRLPTLSNNEVALAFNLPNRFEQAGDADLAAEAYEELGKCVEAKAQDDASYAEVATMMLGSSRRLRLLGNKMKVVGTTLDGQRFDWEAYRGKVVLVDFWATWCGPCLAEMPNVRQNYELYHEKGFDVVGISLDRHRFDLERFLDAEEIPWATLYEDDGSGSHPTADYYGITGIPTVILVDQQGTVVSLNARGPELSRRLAQLLGPPDEGTELVP